MRDGWVAVPLGEVLQQVIEPIPVAPADTYVNLGVRGRALGTFRREPKLGAEVKATKLFRVRPGQFVYNRLFASEGSFGLVGPADAGAVASNEFPVFSVEVSRLLPEFLALYFQQPSVWAVVRQQCTGTTKSRLRWKEVQFLAHRIPLPQIREQQRIVDLFEGLDDAATAAQALADTAKAGWGALREHLCRGEHSLRLGDILAPLHDPVQVDPVATYAQIGLRSHGRGSFDKEPVRGEELGNKKVMRMHPGALCFNIVFAWEGAVTVLGDDVSGKIASHRFPNYASTVTAGERFLASFFRTQLGQELLQDCSPGGAGRNRTLNRGRLMDAVIQTPEVSNWPGVVELLDAAEARCRAADAYVQSLRALRLSLLTVLLSGEHGIPDRYDALLAG